MSVRECDRCHAITKSSGLRCRRNTCIYAKYCFQHTRVKLGLYLAKSSIPNAGKGLFTLHPIKKKAKICDYTGELVRLAGFEGDYGIQMNKKLVLDGRSTQSALGRYANYCRSKNKKKGECTGQNSRFVINNKKKTVYLKATKNIPAHGEIFVSYGANYWKEGW